MVAAIVAPFAEAVRATLQPCTFLLIVPILAAVIAARAHWQALVAATLAGVVGGWILVDNRWILEGWALRVSAGVVAILLAVLVLSSVVGLDRFPASIVSPWPQAGAVAWITLTATMWWRPCVGEQLGAILNGAQDGLAGQLLPMAAYMCGALVPVALVVALRAAIDPPDRLVAAGAAVAATIGLFVAGSLVAGRHEQVVVTLTRWTLEG